ncbi:MAG: DUF1622 domain-containing protein [Dehalococcoidia bacterium]
MDIATFFEGSAVAVEVAGVSVIAAGFLFVTVLTAFHMRRYATPGTAFNTYRLRLVRVLLLGIEFLVAADVIRTVTVDRTLSSLGVLGALVLIRMFLSTSLELELEGRFPWQRRSEDRGQPGT